MAKTKKVTETRCTCQACGNVWHYGAAEAFENFGNAMSDAGKACTCPCCCMGSKKTTKDLNKCPKCGSKANKKEQITHEIAG
jgi:hypothetical protein